MKFDKPTIEAILKDLKDEVPYKYAAESNGIAHVTLKSWIIDGVRDLSMGKNSKYAQFVTSVRQIEKERIKNHLGKINSDNKSHRGSEWTLERSFWQCFSQKAGEIDLNERVESLEHKKGESDVKKEKDDEG